MRALPIVVVTDPKVAALFAHAVLLTALDDVHPFVAGFVSGMVVGTIVPLPDVPAVYGSR
jgi:hypothetical protein